MAAPDTREALLEQGALLFARHGADGVTTRQLHEAVGARNESAVHYHFGGRQGLLDAIVRRHLEAVEARRALLVAALTAERRTGDLRALVHALAAPMAADLETPVGRAHLRIVARLSPPAAAYEPPFRVVDAPTGSAVARWLRSALAGLPPAIRRERLAALRAQLIGLFGSRAELLDDDPAAGDRSPPMLFLANLLDVLVAGLAVAPSTDALGAARRVRGRAR